MSDRDNHGAAEPEPLDLRDRARPMPATGPVIEVAPVEPSTGTADVREPEPIESSLVGQGGLPAAERKPGPNLDAPDLGASDMTPSETREDGARRASGDAGPSLPPPAGGQDRPARRRGGFWPLFLGGVAAAAIGSGATLWALPRLPAAWLPAPAEAPLDESAIAAAATEAARAEVEARTAALTDAARSAGAEAAAAALAEAPPPVAPALDTSALQGLEGRVAVLETLAQRVQALEERPVFAPAPVTEGTLPEDALAPLRQQIESQARQLQELAARPQIDPADIEAAKAAAARVDEIQAQIDAAAQAAEARVAEAQQAAQQVEADVAAASRKAEQLAALASLRTALQSGGDGGTALASLAAAGVEPPPALSVEVPSLESLQEGFDEAARAGLAASLRAAPAEQAAGQERGNLVTNFLRAQTGARSLEPRPGSDPDAVLSRAGAAVGKGDIAAALDEIAALPEAGRAAMTGWLDGARAWVEANGALGALQEQLK